MTLVCPFLFLSLFLGSVSSECSLYGVCHETTAYFNYCPSSNSTRTPRPLPAEDDHLQSQLMSKCPYLFADGNRNLCCDSRQVEALFKMISVANSLFSRCSSCMDNFYKYWCMYTCSPQQANFLKVLDTEPSPTTNRSMAVKVQYDLSRQYAEATFNSCKDVKLSSSSGTAMLMMCGRLRANETCTLERWLNFMGTRSHGLGVPVDIVHKFHETASPEPFMHINTTRCDQAPRPGQSRCLPTDCPNSPVSQQFSLEQSVPQETCRLLGLGCSVYFLLFSVFILVVVLSWAIFPFFSKSRKECQESEDSIDRQAHWIPKQIELNTSLFGEFVFRQPYLTLLSGLLLVIGCCTGLLFLTVISDPIRVWVPPNSRAIEEKNFFDSHFGPFYRVQQIIFYPKPGRIHPLAGNIGPVFQKSFLLEVFRVLNDIRHLSPPLSDGRRVSLEDICFRPMGSGHDCLINSPTNYFQHDSTILDKIVEEGPLKDSDDPFAYDEETEIVKRTYLDHIGDCFRNPYTLQSSLNKSCLASWGGPTFPFLVFGGEGSDPMNATAAIISIPLSSKADVLKMKIWERSFIKFLKKYEHEDIQLSFMAERSIQDEIKRSSEADAFTVVYAAMLMVVYMMIALGGYRNKLSSVNCKILVGFGGVSSIFAVILSSLGLLSFYGLRLPSAAIVIHSFVILVIGSHRVFSVISRMDPLFPSSLGFSLPSALVSSVVQSVVFIIGAFIPVPAVRCFCLLSSLSVVLQFSFLCVLFLPICVLHSRRQLILQERSAVCRLTGDCDENKEISERRLFKRLSCFFHEPLSAIFVMVLSLIILFISPFFISKIELGLDQKLAVSKDSYMYTHFLDMERFLNVGPPVYFVVQGDVDFSKRSWQNKFCSLGGCEDNSVGGILSQAVANPSKSYLTGEVLNWLDTYMEWITPENQCCRVVDRSDSTVYCSNANASKCVSCDSFNADGRPTESIFYRHLVRFTEDVPGPQCVKGGKAAFHDAIHMDPSGHVDASHLMTFHVALKNSSAYISAMNTARQIARKIESSLGSGIRVYPYSVFYIFYEQFATIRTVSAYQLVFAFSTIFLTAFLLLGFDALNAFILLSVCCFQLILQAMGMALWAVDLNSISAVNLVLGVALTIEYSLPVLLALASSEDSKPNAVVVVSDSLTGLTSPLLLGASLFAFAQSPFFNVYFFRMLMVTALSGLFSSLVLLPSLISLSSFLKTKRQLTQFHPVPSGSSALSELSENRSMPQATGLPLLSTVL